MKFVSNIEKMSVAVCFALPTVSHGAVQNMMWNVFSHVDVVTVEESSMHHDNSFDIGETTLFGQVQVNPKWSTLLEVSHKGTTDREDTLHLERFNVRYEITEHHSVRVGKFHTPINYWNDNYHQGRLFFPTIERPLSMGALVPIHESGIRLSGRSMGSHNFFYDAIIGSGQATEYDNKIFSEGITSFAFTAGFSPVQDLVVQVAYFRDKLEDFEELQNGSDKYEDESYQHDYDLKSLSVNYDPGHFLWITEIMSNKVEEDTSNIGIYHYLGYRLSDDLTPYLLYDRLNIKDAVHFKAKDEIRYGVGVSWLFDIHAGVKVELHRHKMASEMMAHSVNMLRVQVQFAY